MRLRLRTLFYNSLLVATVSTTFGPSSLLSQTVPQGPAFGITPFGSYAGYHVDTVNMDNGNDIIRIPLFSLPQLGKLALSFSAVSNITYWEMAGGCSPDGLSCNYYYTTDNPVYNSISQTGGIGPSVVPDQIPSVGLTNELTSNCTGCLNYAYVNWSVGDNTGGNHPLLYDGANPSRLRSADGSGYLFNTNSSQPYNFNAPSPTVWTVVDSNGTKTVQTFHTEGPNYTTVQSDVSGNSITYTPPVGSTVQGFFTDSLRRTIPDIPYPTSSTGGCPNQPPLQPATASSLWSVPGPNNTTAAFLVCYVLVYYHTNFLGLGGQNVCNPNGDGYTCYAEAVGGEQAIQSISLPDGTYWGFVYDSANPSDSSSIAYATLNRLILPQGGSISYTYSNAGLCYSNQQYSQTQEIQSRTTTDINGKTELWRYSINQSYGGGSPAGNTVTDPDGNDTVYVFQDFIAPGITCSDLETSRTTYQGTAPATVLKTETVDQYQQVIAPSPFASQYFHGYANAFRKNRTTTLNGTASAKSSTGYDTSTFTAITPSCQLSTDGTCPRRDGDSAVLSLGMPTATSVTDYSGSVLKNTSTVYAWQSGSPGVCPASGYFSGNLLSTPSQVTTFDSNNHQAAQTTLTYDEATYDPSANCSKGQATTKSMWNNMGTDLQTHTAWTTSGMVDHTIDGNGNQTQFTYDGTGIFAKSVQQPTTSNGVAHIDQYTWDANTGNMTSHTDQNNQVVTNYQYNDPLGRLKLVDSAVGSLDPSGASAESKTSFNYQSATEVDTTQDQFTTGDGALKSRTLYDGLGHAVKTVGQDGSVVETAYDGLDRICAVSNPTFNDPGPLSCVVGQNKTTGATDGYTYFSYDALGRETLQTQPDNNTQRWLYGGNVVDFYDEDQSHWQRTSDALGRLTKLLENDPGGSGVLTLETDYTYDPLNNLTTVNQKGASGDTARYRTFFYDSLSRLTDACNPETIATGSSCTPASGPWSAIYSYYANGNVKSRTDARGIVTNYNYDALNRMITKTYTNDPANTPALSYGYDQAYPWQTEPNENHLVGHLTSIQATLGTTSLVTWNSGDYDPRGILLGHANCLGAENAQGCPGALAAAFYAPNLDGSLAELVEAAGISGSGREQIVLYGYDSAGRLNSIQSYGPASLTSTVFSGSTYYPGGVVKTANLAIDPTTQIPGITLSRTYDNRGRITAETDTDSHQQPAYNYSVNYDGNGNVMGYNDSAAGTWTVNNDALHRLLNMSGTVGGVAYTAQETYDHFGNRNVETVTAGSDQMQPSSYLHFTAGNNRADEGIYDNAGNLFSDGANNYLYDAENRVCAVQQIATGGGGSLIGYLYAPDGTRLGKANLTSFSCDMTTNGMLTPNGLALTNLYTVGPQGEQLEETDGSLNLIHFNVFWEGKVLGSYSGANGAQTNWHFALNDWVGTKRVITNSDGTYANSFFSGPFGDFQTPSGADFDPSEHHFTGKERDIESGLDYFPARYYNSYVGRWMSPDPMGGNLEDPQTLNKYSYVANNPLSRTDPTGLDFNLTCQAAKDGSDASTCQGGLQGTTTQDANRVNHFTATVITSASLSDPNSGNTATVNENGVGITTSQGTFGAKFIDNTPTADINGSGKLEGFSFHIDGSCKGKCLDSGTFKFNGTPDEARNLLDKRGAFRSVVDQTIPGLGHSLDEEYFPEHRNTTQHRFGDVPSPHFSVPRDPKTMVPTVGGFHVDTDAPGLQHFGCAVAGIACN